MLQAQTLVVRTRVATPDTDVPRLHSTNYAPFSSLYGVPSLRIATFRSSALDQERS